MTEFLPNLVLFGDRTGLGRWLVGHYRQHLTYLTTLAAKSPAIVISDHPLLRLGDSDLERKIWLNDHATVHDQLRGYTGIGGIDLADVDLTKPDQFESWMDDHSAEHTLLDQALGLA